MTTLRLNDSKRRPCDWTACVGQNQFVVFLGDIETRIPLAPGGEPMAANVPKVCYIFDAYSEAELFCRQQVEQSERMLCEIYDHRGKSVRPRASFTHPRFAGHIPNRRSARRKLLVGWLLLLPAPVLFWIDYQSEGFLIFPTVVGFAFIITWVRLLFWGYSELEIVDAQEAQLAKERS